MGVVFFSMRGLRPHALSAGVGAQCARANSHASLGVVF